MPDTNSTSPTELAYEELWAYEDHRPLAQSHGVERLPRIGDRELSSGTDGEGARSFPLATKSTAGRKVRPSCGVGLFVTRLRMDRPGGDEVLGRGLGLDHRLLHLVGQLPDGVHVEQVCLVLKVRRQ